MHVTEHVVIFTNIKRKIVRRIRDDLGDEFDAEADQVMACTNPQQLMDVLQSQEMSLTYACALCTEEEVKWLDDEFTKFIERN